MRHFTYLTYRIAGCLLVLGGLLVGVRPVPAQEAQPTPNVADLERRVRELEEIIRQMQAAKQPAAASVTTESGCGPSLPPAGSMVIHPLPEGGVCCQNPAPEVKEGSRECSGEAKCGDGPESQAKNITDELGLRSRGVFEASVTRRVIGAGRVAGWDDGFFLRTPDGSNWLRFGADYQTDYRDFPDDNDKKDIDSFLVRRARLSLDGILGKYYDFRLMVDFSNGQSSTSTIASTRILDAYANVHYWDWMQLEIGKFKQPFGFEQLILDRYFPFMERGLFDQLVPAREPGIMLHGEFLFGDMLDYAVSLSNGEINADYDTNDPKDVVGRLVIRPFNGWFNIPWLCRLQFGIDGTIGIEQESLNGLTLRTPATIPWLSFNNITAVGATSISNVVTAAGRRTRVAPEVDYFLGPFGFSAQYFHENQMLQEGAVGPSARVNVNLPYDGYCILATLFLTGETRRAYTQATEPLRPFEPLRGGWSGIGAWELVGRVSRLELGSQVFTPFTVRSGSSTAVVRLADPTSFSRGCTEMTLGFNWYLNRFVKIQFNYEHDWFDDPVALGSTKKLRFDDALLTRFQFNF